MIPRILVKYPSRGRPERFFDGLDSLYNNLYDAANVVVLVSLDIDDTTMHNNEVAERLAKYKNLYAYYGVSVSKVAAVNRDIEKVPDWEILLIMSDDFRFTFYGWDSIIRQEFLDNDFDKLVHLPDQDAKQMLATMYIAGRKFYNRFGYVYHPSYKSLWCDNEVMDIAQKLGKYKYVDCHGVISHLNPAYGHLPKDEMFIEQQAFWNEDEANYYLRKAINFDL